MLQLLYINAVIVSPLAIIHVVNVNRFIMCMGIGAALSFLCGLNASVILIFIGIGILAIPPVAKCALDGWATVAHIQRTASVDFGKTSING